MVLWDPSLARLWSTTSLFVNINDINESFSPEARRQDTKFVYRPKRDKEKQVQFGGTDAAIRRNA